MKIDIFSMNDNQLSFPCDKCGLCCQDLQSNKLYSELDRGDGTCKFFDLSNKSCKIYKSRPHLCNIAKTYNDYFQENMTWHEFVEVNINLCNVAKLNAKLNIKSKE